MFGKSLHHKKINYTLSWQSIRAWWDLSGYNDLRLQWRYHWFWVVAVGQTLRRESFVLKSCSALSSDTDDKQPSAETLIQLLTSFFFFFFYQPAGLYLPHLSAICHLCWRWHEIWAVREEGECCAHRRRLVCLQTKPARGGKYSFLETFLFVLQKISEGNNVLFTPLHLSDGYNLVHLFSSETWQQITITVNRRQSITNQHPSHAT